MAISNLDRLRETIRSLGMETSKTTTLFRELERIVSTIHTTGRAGGLAGDPARYAAATQELYRLNQALREYSRIQSEVAARAQYRQALTSTNIFTGLPVGAKAREQALSETPTGPDQAQLTRMNEFARVFGVSADATQRASKFLEQYGFSLSNVSRVMIDPITGTKVFTAELNKGDGVIRRASFAFDRFNQQVGDSGTRFKGFTDMISRNTVKVLEWAVAVGVVYGALSQLGQVFTTLVDLNEVMSDIQITTRQSGEELDRYFSSAISVARESGIAVRDVLSVYDDALRATGAIRNEFERAAVATDLLNNAMILARLTGSNVNTAMDQMVGALRQVGASAGQSATGITDMATVLGRGEELIGTWILAARDAKLSLSDLAETFAITGAAASAAGLDIAGLSAVTAVLAENTVKSASEIGNTIRRLITTVESETGIEALKRVGIAVEDINGQMRDWDEIMTEIAARRRAGALSDSAFRQLSYALGGGPRGSADVAVLVDTWDQVIIKTEQYSSQTARAAAMQSALAAKGATLKNAINGLSTSFTSLVVTLGTEGGLINTLQSMLTILSGIVIAAGELTTTLGPATTRLIALGVAFSLLMKYGPVLREKLIPNIGMIGNVRQPMGGTGLPGFVGGGMLQAPGYGFGEAAKTSNRFVNKLVSGQMAVAGLYAASQLMTEGDAQQKGVRFGATIAGAVIGALTPAGPIIGAAIGDAAGNIILNVIEQGRLVGAPIATLKPEEYQARYAAQLKQLEVTMSPFGKLGGIFEPGQISKRPEDVLGALRKGNLQEATKLAQEAAKGRADQYTTEQQITDEILRQAQAILETEAAQTDVGQEITVQTEALKALNNERAKTIGMLSQEAEKMGINEKLQQKQWDAFNKFAAGDLPKKSFKDIKEGAQAALDLGPTAFEAFKDVADVGNDFLDDFMLRFMEMAPEARDEFMDLVTQANLLEEAIAKAIAGRQTEDAAKYARSLELVNAQMMQVYKSATLLEEADPFKFLGFTELGEGANFEEIYARAKQMQDQYTEDLGIKPEDMLGSIDEWVIYADGIYRSIEDVHQAFWKQAESDAKEARKSIEDSFNLQRMKDLGPERFGELQRRARYWENYLNRIPGYAEQAKTEKFNLVLGDQNVFKSLTTTQEALRFAIEDLTEVEKKQLEGQWNIPEGATVMVPLQSLAYLNRGANAPGLPEEMPAVQFGGLTDALNPPADKMNTASDKMLQAAETMATLGAIQYEARRPQEETEKLKAEQWELLGRKFGPERGIDTEAEMKAAQYEHTLREYQRPEDATMSLMGQLKAELNQDFAGLNNTMRSVAEGIKSITANINITIPPINLDGKRVSDAMGVRSSQRLQSAARSRGMGGGGVIQ